MSASVFDAFPTRPMRVRRHGISHPFLIFLGIVFGFVILAMVVISNAPGIMRDWEIAKDPVTLNQARTSNGKCKTRQFVFTDCKVTVVYANAGRSNRQELEFAFFDIHNGDYSVEVIGSRTKPDLVTVDLALDKLWNRIITAGFLSLFGFAMIFGGLYGMARHMNVRRAFRGFNGKILRPVPVELMTVTKSYGMLSALYRFDANGKKRKLTTAMRRQTPFYLDGAEKTALGVTDSHGDYVLLLDQALERLDFTDSEREALRNAAATNTTAPQPAFSPAMAGIEPAR